MMLVNPKQPDEAGPSTGALSTWRQTLQYTSNPPKPPIPAWTPQYVNALSHDAYLQARQTHGILMRDPVHSDVILGPLAARFYFTYPVQRLKHLHQLGAAHYIFQGAQHDRLAHSVGVAHLAWQQADYLRQSSADIRYWDLELLEVAGLLHDIGHGAFSHVFEHLFLTAVGMHHWHHENMSHRLLDYTIQHCNIPLDDDSIAKVKDMLSGAVIGSSTTSWPGWTPNEQWKLQIVANVTNSIDVDKIDYLMRDAVGIGVCSSTQDPVLRGFKRILQHSKVIKGQICYGKDVQQDIGNLYHARAFMHHNVYQHPEVKAAEFMIVTALKLADPDLHSSSRVKSVEDYLTLDDRILYSILDQAAADPNNKNLQEAAATIERLESKQMYPCVAEAEVPQEVLKCGYQCLKACDIVAAHNSTRGANIGLDEMEVAVHNVRVDYCKGLEDPMKQVLLYSSTAGGDTLLQQASEDYSDGPAAYMVQKERVYLTKPTSDATDQRAYSSAVVSAFKTLMQQRCGPNVQVRVFADEAAPATVSSHGAQGAGTAGVLVQGRSRLLDQAQQQQPQHPRLHQQQQQQQQQQQLLQQSFLLKHATSLADGGSCLEDDENTYLSSQQSVQSQVDLPSALVVQDLQQVCAFGLDWKRRRFD